MQPMRVYRSFSWKDTNLRVACEAFDLVTRTVVEERRKLERYIGRHPEFKTALIPVVLLEEAPEVARRMAAAADLTGLGPMASVAGTLAQMGVEAAMAAGCREAIVENGGDIFIHSDTEVTIGIYAGDNAIGNQLAFRIDPAEPPPLPLFLIEHNGPLPEFRSVRSRHRGCQGRGPGRLRRDAGL